VDEFAIDIGVVSNTNRLALDNEPLQHISSNIMGYNNSGFPPVLPLKDFFSWQIQTIRRGIESRMQTR
jgi:hypothetical protein